ncbi:MAG: hypothetical protein HY057_03545, partial [Rhodospirillales bacterium]|nr:hypothetical protein [Rhodospirillales bacterium]
MTRKNAIPGVDEEALAALARQFPSGGTRAPDFSASTSTPAAPAPAPRAGGRGLAVFSLFVALIALAVGAVAIAGPLIRPWLVAKLGSHRLIDLATGYRADVDQRFSAVSSGIDGVKIELGAVGSRAASLERGASTMATRVGAVETGVEAAAK